MIVLQCIIILLLGLNLVKKSDPSVIYKTVTVNECVVDELEQSGDFADSNLPMDHLEMGE